MKIDELLLEEIRENRKEIAGLRSEINSIKIKLATFTSTISIVFGFIGAFVKEKLIK